MFFAVNVVSVLLSSAVAQAGSAGPAGNIAVINLTRVFERYQMTRDLEGVFEQERQNVAGEAQKRRDEIQMGRNALRDLKPGTPDFVQREEEQIKKEVEFQAWLEIQERRLKERHKSWLQLIYQHVRDVVAKMSADKHLDLVLTYNDIQDDAADSTAYKQQILLRTVLFATDRVDLTEPVIEALDTEYQRRGGSATLVPGGVATPPPPAPK